MLVFIDENGDPGIKVASGSSPVFVMAMVIFENGEAAAQTCLTIDALRANLGFRTEFKFNKSREEVRSAFLAAVASCPFRVRAIVVEKERIRSAVLREDKEGCCQADLNQSPFDAAVAWLARFQAMRFCHSASATERRAL